MYVQPRMPSEGRTSSRSLYGRLPFRRLLRTTQRYCGWRTAGTRQLLRQSSGQQPVGETEPNNETSDHSHIPHNIRWRIPDNSGFAESTSQCTTHSSRQHGCSTQWRTVFLHNGCHTSFCARYTNRKSTRQRNRPRVFQTH